MFGICLGHQLIALSYGAKTYKLKFGHRGGNHPVRDVRTGKIEITSQNHSYAVDAASIPQDELKISHINLLDNTVEGLYSNKNKVFSAQYHPESAPGPCDSMYLFNSFTELMRSK
jgi:carbamoyl-phosphate synthase small subunit